MLALTPPLGWNSWNTFGQDLCEEVIHETVQASLDLGLKDAGYQYMVLDDFWEADNRVQGRLTWDTHRFPSGIPHLAHFVHEKGLKIGIYSCAGTHTCGNKPASFSNEQIDAQSFAEWEMDFLKYDFCHVPSGADAISLYRRMGQALRSTKRPILYSVCEWGLNKPWNWGASVGAHMWRTTGDINDSWDSIVETGFNRQTRLHPYAGPGHWNDPDMLVVGMYGKGNVGRQGCSDAEYRSHFVLWCLLSAPLILGCDIRTMNQFTRDLITNPHLIAVNQDPMGRQAQLLGKTEHGGPDEIAMVWAKPLLDGSLAVGLFNLGSKDNRLVSVAWESLGLSPDSSCLVIDLLTGKERGAFSGFFSCPVSSHDTVPIRIVPLPNK